jgi:DNA-binding transcriptional MocR family regulator
LPLIQFVDRPGILDLAWGHPDPALLPTEAWAEASAATLRRHGWHALTYGWAAGPAPLIEWLCDRLGVVDGRRPVEDEMVVTAGASAALHLVTSLLTRPGEVALVEAPSYHLAHRILADGGLHVMPVRLTAPDAAGGTNDAGGTGGAGATYDAGDSGHAGDALRAAVELQRAAGRRVALLYTVPTFNNPTGASLTPGARTSLVAAAAALGVLIVEDDTYRELAYDGPAPPSLYSEGVPGAVVRVGSFAKSVAPGLRLGFLTGGTDLAARLVASGVLDSGGGLNHSVALTMATFGASGAFDRHLAVARDAYRERRDLLVTSLAKAVAAAAPDSVRLAGDPPAGGWFLWLRLAEGRSAAALLPAAEAAGTSFLPGATFHAGAPDDSHIRLSFSHLPPPSLTEAADRLAHALAAARSDATGHAAD